MKSICLILSLSGHMIPIDKPFPTADACERAGFSMTDGQTVKGYACLPRIMVDGLPVYDCGKYPDIDLTPPPEPPSKCRFEILAPSGKIVTVSAECDAIINGVINILPPKTPTNKYTKPLE
jgi:hypothetical protein